MDDPAVQEPESAQEEPEAAPEPSGAAKVESYSAGLVFECSLGDFVSRASAAEVKAHIAASHKGPRARK